MIYLYLVAEILGAMIIVWQAIVRYNLMGKCRLPIVAAWMAMGAAAVGILQAALLGQLVPDWRSALLVAAVAIVTVTDRRRPR